MGQATIPRRVSVTKNSNREYLIAYCTCPPEKAAAIAGELVKRKVCACVNIVPAVQSVYAWKGEVEEDAESLLVIKTRRDRFPRLEQSVREIHPYEVFELVACRVDLGNPAYLRWIDESV